MANFQLFFQSREQVVVRLGPDPENRVGDHDTGRPGTPVSSGLQVRRGMVVQEQDSLGDLTIDSIVKHTLNKNPVPSFYPEE